MRITIDNVAFYLLPFIVISPAIRLGSFAISATDAVIIILGLVIILSGNIRTQKFFFIFLLLFTLGWLGALINGFFYHDILYASEITHFYRILFYFSAFSIGYYSRHSLEKILLSKMTTYIFLFLFVFILTYLFSPVEIRSRLMILYMDVQEESHRLLGPRFPGINANINIFSFIPFTISIFSLNIYLKRNRKILLLFILSSLILILGMSRKLTVMWFIFSFISLIHHFFILRETRIINKLRINLRLFMVFFFVLIISIGSVLAFLSTEIGKRSYARLRILLILDDRSEELRELYTIASTSASRFDYMLIGMDRVALSPIFGIPEIRSNEPKLNNLISFHKPHNEFILIWMYYGIFGLLSVVFFLLYAVYYNYRARSYVWMYFYLCVVIQTFFDTTFAHYQLSSVLFIMTGLNFRKDQINNPG